MANGKAPMIEPEDNQPDEQITIRLRPEVARDLRAYGKYVNGSSASHVVSSTLKWLFAADKGFQGFKQEHPDAGSLQLSSRRKSRSKAEARA
jgi:hypothetical protein